MKFHYFKQYLRKSNKSGATRAILNSFLLRLSLILSRHLSLLSTLPFRSLPLQSLLRSDKPSHFSDFRLLPLTGASLRLRITLILEFLRDPSVRSLINLSLLFFLALPSNPFRHLGFLGKRVEPHLAPGRVVLRKVLCIFHTIPPLF